ncbi:MAG: hypothetical protein AB7P69_09940 [Candidatus Binatia bacterium]
MRRCLREEALWLVFEGSGSRVDREHVEHCEKCSTRLRQLKTDVQFLSRVLRDPPPAPAAAHTPRVLLWRWASVVAVGAAALALVWNGWLTWKVRPPQPTASTMTRQAEIVEILADEVSSALFTNDDLAAVEISARVSTLAYVQAALDGGWPCERRPARRGAVCAQRPFFLTAEDQGG